MRKIMLAISTILFTVPAWADELPAGSREIGRFDGSIGGQEYSLISVAYDGSEDTDMDHVLMFGMQQYSIALKNGLDEYQAGKYPLLELIIQPDPMASDEDAKKLRMDTVSLYNSGNMMFPDYSSQLQSGFGTAEIKMIKFGEDGRISFDFTADLPKVAFKDLTLTPVADADTIHIEGHFSGTVPKWAFYQQ